MDFGLSALSFIPSQILWTVESLKKEDAGRVVLSPIFTDNRKGDHRFRIELKQTIDKFLLFLHPIEGTKCGQELTYRVAFMDRERTNRYVFGMSYASISISED